MLGFLKIAGGIARGVGNFIKKRKAVKAEKLDKAQAKIAERRAALSGIGFSSGDAIKESGISAAMKNFAPDKLPKKVEALNISEKVSGVASAGGSNKIIMIAVAAIAAIFLLPKLLKK
jgi:hypothetical protein